MKTYSIAVSCMWIGLISLTGCDMVTDSDNGIGNIDSYAEVSFHEEITIDSQTLLKLTAVNGKVDIVGEPFCTDKLVISGTRRVGSDSREDARRHMDDLQVRITEKTHEVAVRVDQPITGRREYSVDFSISLPEDMDVHVGLVNGSVSLERTFGDATIGLINGNIESEVTLPSSGSLDFSTVNGNIQLLIPPSTSADLSAAVLNGGVTTSRLEFSDVRIQSGKALEATLGNGDGRISLASVNGDIEVTGRTYGGSPVSATDRAECLRQ